MKMQFVFFLIEKHAFHVYITNDLMVTENVCYKVGQLTNNSAKYCRCSFSTEGRQVASALHVFLYIKRK